MEGVLEVSTNGMGSLMGAIHKRDVSTNRSCPPMRGVHY